MSIDIPRGHTVLVTGGLGRLGRAIVDTVESRGGTALATTRDRDRADAFNREAEKQNRRARARVLHFETEGEIDAFMAATAEEFGGIHALVNNAFAQMPYQSAEDTDWNAWAEAIRGNVGYAHSCAVAAVRRREVTGISSIVNVASIYGVLAPDFRIYGANRPPAMATYSATKAALIQLTRYLAVYWARLGIRVNAVSPGGLSDNQDEEFARRYSQRVPMARMSERSEVAEAIGFLVSDESRGITGENFMVDGGLHAW